MRRRRNPLVATPLPSLAADACRLLILAYKSGHQHVDWNDVQEALAKALEAFGLPASYIEDER